MEYKYTLIIPHYNIPQLLRRLLRTVPRRTDMQVIVVDDCSTKELDVLDDVKREFDWVEWYSTGTNGGGGKARNIGLEHAKGEYLFFADADDYFSPGIYEFLEEYKATDFDMVFFNVSSVANLTYQKADRNLMLNSIFKLYKRNPEKATQKFRLTFGEPWCKLISKSLINNNEVRFDEILCHNDTRFSYLCGFHAKNTHVDERVLYTVTERSASVINTQFKERERITFDVFLTKELFLIQNKTGEHAYDIYDEPTVDLMHGRLGKAYRKIKRIKRSIPLSNILQIVLRRIFNRTLYKITGDYSNLI